MSTQSLICPEGLGTITTGFTQCVGSLTGSNVMVYKLFEFVHVSFLNNPLWVITLVGTHFDVNYLYSKARVMLKLARRAWDTCDAD